jgi:hypothetical protein
MTEEVRPTSTALDPASDAAAMLLRLGFAIFALVMPSATLMSRWVIVVLVPIGAVLIILSALIKDDPARIWRSTIEALLSIAGLTAVLLAIWALVSLGWTPVPGEASEKLLKALGILALGLLAVVALPRRMRATNLHLITIGVAIGALLILLASLGNLLGVKLLVVPAATPGRVAVMLTVLVWLGAGWMLIKDRPKLAVALVVLVSFAIAFGPTRDAILPLLVSIVVVGAAWNAPERVGRVLAVLAATLVLSAPFLALAASVLPQSFGLGALGGWGALIAAEPLRILTGHGYDAAAVARTAGVIPEGLLFSLIGDFWFDLGLLGALAIAGLSFLAFRVLAELGLELAPVALGSLSAGFVYALVERGSTQTWWLNAMTVATIVLVSLGRGRYRTVRPRAGIEPSLRSVEAQPA